MSELSRLEKEECESIDATAATFGELLGSVAAFGLEGADKAVGYEIGFHLGKWIYVADACDDFEKDKKKGSYNVLRLAFGEELTDSDRELIRNAMYLELDKMSKALELIDFSQCRDVEAIIKNVAYDGLIVESKRVLKLQEV